VRNSTTQQGSGVWGGRNNNRAYSQFLRVKSVNNTTVTFEPPIYGNYWTVDLAPEIYWWGRSTIRSGIEDLQVNRVVGGSALHNLHMALADSCWIRNVKAQQADQGLIRAAWTMNCEIRDCFLTQHDNVGSATYSLYLTYCGSLLAQNNIGYVTPCFVGMGEVMGSVIAYNYATNFPYSVSTWLPECVMLHGGHNYFNLFEGNIAPSFWADLIHGNASYTVVHRNKFTGWEPGKTGSLSPVNMEDYQDFFSFAGNVLGTSGIQSSYGSIFDINATSLSTVVRKGNFNYVNNGIPTSESLGSDTLEASYYLPSKPSWFGNRPWPAIDPTRASAATATNTPAGYRFVYGRLPTAGPLNLAPIARVSATPTSGAAPLSVAFSSAGSSDPEGASLTYSWVFGDGGTSASANPSHSYTADGQYTARLTVSDGTNSTTSSNLIIRVGNQAPVVAADGNPKSGLMPLSVVFSSVGTSDPEGATLTYNWNFGDNSTSTAANPVHIYQNAGSYLAQLVVSDGQKFATSSVVNISVVDPASTLVAAYGFEEGSGTTTADLSGNGNAGSITSGTWRPGKFGNALLFNGTSSLVTINDSLSIDLTTEATLEAWVNPSALGGWRNIIYKEQDIYFLMGSTPQGPADFGGTFASGNVYGASALPLNTWTHLAATYDGATMRFYVNGVLANSRAQTGAIQTSAGPLTIGGDLVTHDAGPQFWSGLIDEVRIYKRALSASEIQADMNTAIKPSKPSNFRVVGAQ
jgi:PKD repeat protein